MNEKDVVQPDEDVAPGFTSASEGYPPGGLGGRPPTRQGAVTRDPGFTSASEGYPPGGLWGRPPRRESPPRRHGATLWFTGLPSAGKSTIAHALAAELRADGVDVQVLDGDEVRPHLSAGLGFTREDRNINVTRIGWVARLLASHGVVVLVPVIAPYADARQAVRDDHVGAGVPFAEVYVSTALDVAESRDVKGLYAQARRGELNGMTGVDDPYETPALAELVLDTSTVDLATAVARSQSLTETLLASSTRQETR